MRAHQHARMREQPKNEEIEERSRSRPVGEGGSMSVGYY
jgi:hypothetical protein